MQTSMLPLRETYHIGPQCREWVIASERVPQLGARRFVWVGHSEIVAPYRMVRLNSIYTHVVACFKGRGRVLINNELVDWHEGQILLSPQGSVHAFEAVGTEPWLLAWVFMDDRKGDRLLSGARTQLVDGDVSGFVQILQMLTKEVAGALDASTVQALVTLLQTHTVRLSGQARVDARLSRLWQAVEADLSRNWDVKKLARTVFMSEEHLRRLCHRDCHRSPMNQVKELRMHRAGILLRASAGKVEDIALQVGFASLYSFSAAFKRWSGVTPSMFRQGDNRSRRD